MTTLSTKTLGLFLALAATLLASCKVYPPVRETGGPDYGRALPAGANALLKLGSGERVPNVRSAWFQRDELMPALEESLRWTRSKHASQFFPIEGISHAVAIASLERFGEMVQEAETADELQVLFENEFDVYKSAGWDGRGGGVLFTGYCTPLLAGSLEPGDRYQYPLHALPPDLVKAKDGTTLGQETPSGMRPYPRRRTIVKDAAYRSLELVWLKDPVDAYIAHVNGSAFVELESGEIARFGYAGKNGQPYSSLGKALIDANEVPAAEMSLAAIRRWAERTPLPKVEAYLDRNDSYVFFTEISGNPHGSLNVPVTARRSVATDKTLFPRGAITFVDTKLPAAEGPDVPFQQVMFDQDTGGAIRTAGRADLYLGVGHRAEQLSGATRATGQLYYFFLRP